MLLLIYFLFISIFNFIYCSEWNYIENGPDVWEHEYESCHGRLQSPINLDTKKAVYDSKLKHFNFFGYDKVLYWNISNNGHTIISSQVPGSNLKPFVNGSDFQNETFYLDQFHFHWGFNIYQGSEHHIEDIKFPLEVHMVHKSNKNRTAVLAFIFQISEKNNTDLNSLLDMIGQDIKEKDYHITNFSLNSFLPNFSILNHNGYYRYIGSLTTPPCSEGVVWSVFSHKINISKSQMGNFYRNVIKFNYRDVQGLNNRTLYISDNNLTPIVIDNKLKPDLIINPISNFVNFVIKLFKSIFNLK